MLPIQCQGKSSYPCSSVKAGASKAYPQIRSEKPRSLGGGGGTGDLPYKSDRVARQKIKIKPLRETSVGVDQT